MTVATAEYCFLAYSEPRVMPLQIPPDTNYPGNCFGDSPESEPEDALSHTNLSRLLQQKGLVPEAEDAMAIATRLQMKK